MRKVLFLMFLLLLMGLGAAGVKAQVRIGGNGAPNAAAVLDLNATDATTNGTKGLALPRVSLANVSTPLTGTPVVTGMMVYNTNASTTGGSGVGIYYWAVDSSKWVKVINSDFTVPISKLLTTPADSGLTLMSNGTSVVWTNHAVSAQDQTIYTASTTPAGNAVSWTLVGIYTWTPKTAAPNGTYAMINCPGVYRGDLCVDRTNNGFVLMYAAPAVCVAMDVRGWGLAAVTHTFACYRPSA